MVRIVAVGGLGYVGVNIAPALLEVGELVVVYRGLARGFRRVIASRLESLGARLVRLDPPITADGLERLGGDVYIHLAGKISGRYRVQWESHVGLLESVIEAAERLGSRVVYTSSVLAYGRLEDLPPGSIVYEEEEHLSGRRRWRSHHARTKAEGEKLLVSSSGRLGGRFSIVRPGLVVGSHAYHREWSILFTLARLGLYPRLDYTVNYVSSRVLGGCIGGLSQGVSTGSGFTQSPTTPPTIGGRAVMHRPAGGRL
ncbi:NAD-dependent epimerase/dehydratase family protein [Aeropyrum camini]|uniref:NAD-dependent epimerase/dehydratase family protein n=1 Tax=Aeropyrum camini TaxID=229980 RepID=UPI000788D2D2|nr:NAD(P)-dependent oxidoreductase [Aeropyrum camini]